MQSTRKANNEKIISQYFETNHHTKLHIGCGKNYIQGWLNADIKPAHPQVIQLDASIRFPFFAEVFDLIFSEHMIEHLNYEDGLNMLSESFRVLKPGGRIRISTPDLNFLINLYTEEKTTLQEDYSKWAASRFIQSKKSSPAFILNNFVRNWGHHFIYDKETLYESLFISGFTNIKSKVISESDISSFKKLEREDRMPKGFLQLETMTFEATKPKIRFSR